MYTYITESDILFSVTKWEHADGKYRLEPKIEPIIALQVLHAQGDAELTTVTQKALLERQQVIPIQCLSQFKFQEEPY